MSKPKITVDLSGIEKKFSPSETRAKQAVFAQRVGSDMNKHCPVDEGTLRDSMPVASDFEHGRIIWDTPYAKDRYNADHVMTTKNQNAAPHWAEVAKSEKLESWRTMAGKLFGKSSGSFTIGGDE